MIAVTEDFRGNLPAEPHPPLTIHILLNNPMSAIEYFKFLGFTISHELKWETLTL